MISGLFRIFFPFFSLKGLAKNVLWRLRIFPADMSRLVICQRDGKMKFVLDNGHFVRSKFGRDAGFWRSYN